MYVEVGRIGLQNENVDKFKVGGWNSMGFPELWSLYYVFTINAGANLVVGTQ